MPTFTPGLVSVTFRDKTPAEIVALCAQAETPLIEWGGDVHVPHGDIACARAVGAMTRDAGLCVAAYGSYYRVGADSGGGGVTFEQCLASAEALGAPTVRVWAGPCGSAAATDEQRARVVSDTQRICDLAAGEGIAVAFEFHGGTLTDTLDSTLSLLAQAGRPNLRTLWQPHENIPADERVSEIDALRPWLAHVHVFQGAGGSPVDLASGRNDWQLYLPALAQTEPPPGLLIEFVRGGTPAQFLADAAALRAWIAALR